MAETAQGRTPRSRSPDELGAGLGLLAAAAAAWGVHRFLPPSWPGAGVDLPQWLGFTLRNLTRPAAVDRAWSVLWQTGARHDLAALAAVALLAWGLVFVALTGRSPRTAPLALLAGAALGTAGGLVLPRIPDMPVLLWVVAPALGLFLFGSFATWLVAPRCSDTHLRGARVEPGREKPASAAVLRKAVARGQVCFAGTVLAPEAECTHLLVTGATGSGKSVALGDLLATVVARDDPMVVADPGGEAMSHHWRSGDVILNPFDARCAKWDLFSDLVEDSDHERVAAALLPLSGNEESARWTRRGRDLLATLMGSYRRLGVGGSDDFAHFLRTAGPDMMAELVEGTAAAPLFEPGNERLRGSVIDELAPATRLLSRMAAVEGEPFSIRDWVRAGTQDAVAGRVADGGSGSVAGGSRLWLPYRINELDSLRAAIGCWIGLAAMEVMSLPPSRTRRVWFVADELDMLGRVPNLEQGLTNGRRFGACFALGFQSIAQLRETYGDNVAAVIEENIATRLLLRSDGFGPNGTAEYASRMIGEREVDREEISVSSRRGDSLRGGGGSTSRAMRQRTERAVLPAEIGQLANLDGYLRTAGSGAWRKIRLPVPKDRPVVAETRIPAKWGKDAGTGE